MNCEVVIIHIASISNDPFSGVCVIVPQHVIAQSEYEQVAFINTNNVLIEQHTNQLEYKVPFQLEDLPKPFSKPDLVVIHEVYNLQHLRIALYLRKKGVKYILVPHGELTIEALKKKWVKKKVANLLLFNRMFSWASAIQCLSQKELINTHLKQRKFIGTNGLFLPNMKKTEFSEKGTCFVYVGRLEAQIKGLDLMLSAIEKQKGFLRKNNCSLHIYGPELAGRYAHVESLIAEKHIGDLVILNHEVIGEEKRRALLEGDVFIQTSRTEGMPLGILEALSYGLPVVITKGTSLGEVVKQYNAGWVVETTSDAIAEAIVAAVNDKQTFVEKSKAAMRLAKEQFSWDVVAKQTIEKYREITKGA